MPLPPSREPDTSLTATISQRLRSLYALFLAVPATFLISAACLVDLILIRRDEQKAQFFPRLWGKSVCRFSGVKVEISGVEHLDPEATYIFIGNHISQFDIFAFQGYFPHDFRWIAKKELFRIPLFGPAMRQAGIIPIDRSHGRQALKSLDAAAARIAAGSSVLIFPEGTRSPDGRLRDFKNGAALLAIKAGVEVVPIGFNHTNHILPKGSWLPKAGTASIRIGPPLSMAGYTTRDKQALSDAFRQAIRQLLDPEHREA